MTKLEPRCFPKPFEKRKNIMGIAYIATGYLMPCCWLDNLFYTQEYKKLGLYDEELKLANNKCVDDIVCSKQWQNFTRILTEEPHNAPTMCKRKCGT